MNRHPDVPVPFLWRRMQFQPDSPRGFCASEIPDAIFHQMIHRNVEATWVGARGWSVSQIEGMFFARWDPRIGAQSHPKVIGSGDSLEAALEDCRRQLQSTLAVVKGEITLRVDRRDALTAELGRLD